MLIFEKKVSTLNFERYTSITKSKISIFKKEDSHLEIHGREETTKSKISKGGT